jgi:hypothetical protein
MFERYTANLHALCARMDLPVRLREEDILIRRLYLDDGFRCSVIPGTSKNLGGRLFFQEKLSRRSLDLYVQSAFISTRFKEEAMEHFAELWNDAEREGRTLIAALKRARHIGVVWKFSDPLSIE